MPSSAVKTHGGKVEKLYKVVFKGEIVEGKARDTVQQDLATLLRINPEKAARLFAGRPVVIGKNLTRGKAVRHLAALDGAGAIGHIEPMPAAPGPAGPVSLAKPGSARNAPTPAPARRAVSPDTNVGKTCLKCGHVRKAGDPPPDIECPACHAIYARVEEARRKQAGQQPPSRVRSLWIRNQNDTWALPRPVGFKGWLRRGLAWTFGVLFLLVGLMVPLTSPLAALLALALGALLLPPIRAFVHGRTGVSLRPGYRFGLAFLLFVFFGGVHEQALETQRIEAQAAAAAARREATIASFHADAEGILDTISLNLERGRLGAAKALVERYRVADDPRLDELHAEVSARMAAQTSQAQATRKRAAAEQAQTQAAACRRDLQCWGEEHSFKAILPCESVLPRMAKYDYEWTDGWLEFKFPRFRWHDRDRGSLTYIGDKARFQNGFGAWQNVIYECDYDPATEQVLDFRVRPGRFSG